MDWKSTLIIIRNYNSSFFPLKEARAFESNISTVVHFLMEVQWPFCIIYLSQQTVLFTVTIIGAIIVELIKFEVQGAPLSPAPISTGRVARVIHYSRLGGEALC